MSAKWVGFAVFVYVIGLLVAYISTGQDVFSWSNMTNPVHITSTFSEATSQEDWGTFSFVAASFNNVMSYFQGLWKVLTLQLPVFQEGPWRILRWVILAPITATIIYGLVTTFFGMFQREA